MDSDDANSVNSVLRITNEVEDSSCSNTNGDLMAHIWIDLKKKDNYGYSTSGRTLHLSANQNRSCSTTWLNDVNPWDTYHIQIVQKEWKQEIRHAITGSDQGLGKDVTKKNCTSQSTYPKYTQWGYNTNEFKNCLLYTSDAADE